jgi:hypothetical protein
MLIHYSSVVNNLVPSFQIDGILVGRDFILFYCLLSHGIVSEVMLQISGIEM